MNLADPLPIQPLDRPPNAVVRVPGSKSITNRAMVLAALYAKSECLLHGALQSEDTEVMAEALRRLGFAIEPDWQNRQIRVSRPLGSEVIPVRKADLFCANSGTTMRFLTAMVALGRGRYRLDGVERMRQRPMRDLLDALQQLGVRAWSERGDGCPPVIVEANGMSGGTVRLRGDTSSQFLSGLLMAAPLAQRTIRIEIVGPLVSQPYVQMTLTMLRQFGVREVRELPGPVFVLHPPTDPAPAEYSIEPDASAASYFFAAAAITGGSVTVTGLPYDGLQGDVHFVDLLEAMGCTVRRGAEGITVIGGALRGIDADMNAISDTVMTLAVVACFAEGPTTIRNVAHIRLKETDRLAALAAELRRAGVGVEEREDGLTVHPAPLRPAVFETYNDHRMAMSLALLGLRVPGMAVRDPKCVAKTYPGFFADLEQLRR
ncbi:MAG: 3-phosphoshikimate 1-carboxyvinyltransferase [Gemmatales bacterium]|nr:3-phosphoshikimate 1-carboxyvinyltransferase [Gemmatales bacterium]MDW8385706.1 3-phosphoshikimate 1-carboxyvinyltransferase [Gemmatales bacterium]